MMTMDEMLVKGDIENFLGAIRKTVGFKLKNRTFAGIEHEDVVQEVLLKVYTAIDAYDPSKTKASTFFGVVIDNKIKDIFKSLASESNLMNTNYVPLVIGDDDDDRNVIDLCGVEDSEYECSDIIYDIMNNYGLSDLEKSIIKLRVAEFSNIEIAETLGMSKQSLNYHLRKMEKKLEVFKRSDI